MIHTSNIIPPQKKRSLWRFSLYCTYIHTRICAYRACVGYKRRVGLWVGAGMEFHISHGFLVADFQVSQLLKLIINSSVAHPTRVLTFHPPKKTKPVKFSVFQKKIRKNALGGKEPGFALRHNIYIQHIVRSAKNVVRQVDFSLSSLGTGTGLAGPRRPVDYCHPRR